MHWYKQEIVFPAMDITIPYDTWDWQDVCVFCTNSNCLHACIQDSLDTAYLCMYVQVFCPAFYVVYDHQEKAIVVAIRGSMTVQVGKNYVLSYINLHHNTRVNCFYYSRLLFT